MTIILLKKIGSEPGSEPGQNFRKNRTANRFGLTGSEPSIKKPPNPSKN